MANFERKKEKYQSKKEEEKNLLEGQKIHTCAELVRQEQLEVSRNMHSNHEL